MPPRTFAERHLNPLQDDIVIFPPLLEGNPPQGLVNGLGEVDGAMHDSGPRLSACGPCWAFWAWGTGNQSNKNC
jgi:hypothetical protein